MREYSNYSNFSQKAQYEMVGAALFEANQLKPRKKNNNKTVLSEEENYWKNKKKLAQCRKNNYDKQKLFWLFLEQFF